MKTSYLLIVLSILLASCSTNKSNANSAKESIKNQSKTPVVESNRPITNLANTADVQNFISNISQKHNMDKKWLTDIFNRTELKPTIVNAMDRPAEAMNWGKYRPIFITDKRINDGVTFYKKHQSSFERAEKTYGVNAEVIAAIIGVETSYGQNKGNWAVVDALSTLAFDYPRRANYFSQELENFLLIVQETNRDPFSYKGSYAGAMGYPQFMPSSYLSYAIDFDNDGIRDLWDNPVDAIGSVGNYLNKSGWRANSPIATKVTIKNSATALKHSGKISPPKNTLAQLQNAGVQGLKYNAPGTLFEFEVSKSPKVSEWWVGYQNFYAITRYNHSQLYALAVFQLAEAIKQRI